MTTSNEESRSSNNNEERVVPFVFRAYTPKDNALIKYLRGLNNRTKYIKELILEDEKYKQYIEDRNAEKLKLYHQKKKRGVELED